MRSFDKHIDSEPIVNYTELEKAIMRHSFDAGMTAAAQICREQADACDRIYDIACRQNAVRIEAARDGKE